MAGSGSSIFRRRLPITFEIVNQSFYFNFLKVRVGWHVAVMVFRYPFLKEFSELFPAPVSADFIQRLGVVSTFLVDSVTGFATL